LLVSHESGGTFDYGQDIVGVFGWLDTPVPSAVFVVWSAFIGVVVLSALIQLRERLVHPDDPRLGDPVAHSHRAGRLRDPWLNNLAGKICPRRVRLCDGRLVDAVLAKRLRLLDLRALRQLVLIVFACWSLAQFYSFAIALERDGVEAAHSSWRASIVNPTRAFPGGTLVSCDLLSDSRCSRGRPDAQADSRVPSLSA
jgi:hypothetical protein